MRGAHGRARLQHERNRARGIERCFARQQIAQRAALQQLHHDVKPTVGGHAEIGDRYRVRMMHASGRARLPAKSLLRCFVTDEPLAENFDSHRAFDQQMRGPVNRAHPAAAEPLVQAIFAVERLTNQWVNWNIGDRRICL